MEKSLKKKKNPTGKIPHLDSNGNGLVEEDNCCKSQVIILLMANLAVCHIGAGPSQPSCATSNKLYRMAGFKGPSSLYTFRYLLPKLLCIFKMIGSNKKPQGNLISKETSTRHH